MILEFSSISSDSQSFAILEFLDNCVCRSISKNCYEDIDYSDKCHKAYNNVIQDCRFATVCNFFDNRVVASIGVNNNIVI